MCEFFVCVRGRDRERVYAKGERGERVCVLRDQRLRSTNKRRRMCECSVCLLFLCCAARNCEHHREEGGLEGENRC